MTLQELENSISNLTPQELARFRSWFIQFDSDRWDEQIRLDAEAGKLNALADAALEEHRAGQTKPL